MEPHNGHTMAHTEPSLIDTDHTEPVLTGVPPVTSTIDNLLQAVQEPILTDEEMEQAAHAAWLQGIHRTLMSIDLLGRTAGLFDTTPVGHVEPTPAPAPVLELEIHPGPGTGPSGFSGAWQTVCSLEPGCRCAGPAVQSEESNSHEIERSELSTSSTFDKGQYVRPAGGAFSQAVRQASSVTSHRALDGTGLPDTAYLISPVPDSADRDPRKSPYDGPVCELGDALSSAVGVPALVTHVHASDRASIPAVMDTHCIHDQVTTAIVFENQFIGELGAALSSAVGVPALVTHVHASDRARSLAVMNTHCEYNEVTSFIVFENQFFGEIVMAMRAALLPVIKRTALAVPVRVSERGSKVSVHSANVFNHVTIVIVFENQLHNEIVTLKQAVLSPTSQGAALVIPARPPKTCQITNAQCIYACKELTLSLIVVYEDQFHRAGRMVTRYSSQHTKIHLRTHD
jgi:hypothetical protein